MTPNHDILILLFSLNYANVRIQSNKIILRKWQNLRDLLVSTEDFLINIDKKISNSF